MAGRAVRWTKVWDTLVEVSDCQVYLQSFTSREWIDGNDRLSSTRILSPICLDCRLIMLSTIKVSLL